MKIAVPDASPLSVYGLQIFSPRLELVFSSFQYNLSKNKLNFDDLIVQFFLLWIMLFMCNTIYFVTELSLKWVKSLPRLRKGKEHSRLKNDNGNTSYAVSWLQNVRIGEALWQVHTYDNTPVPSTGWKGWGVVALIYHLKYQEIG